MRSFPAFLASVIGVTCAAVAVSLPLAIPTSAAPRAADASDVPTPGSTQSIPLAPLGSDRVAGQGAFEQGVGRRDVRSFSLVGVVWDNPEAELHGRVQVRTRATGTPHWSGWQDVETHNHAHAADPDTAESASGRVRGSTAPLWVGDSDGVELRVRAETKERTGASGVQALPDGLRLELVDPGADPGAGPGAAVGAGPGAAVGAGPGAGAGVDPGDEPPPAGPAAEGAPVGTSLVPLTVEGAAASAVNAELVPLGAGVIPALSKKETDQQIVDAAPEVKTPYIGPRPRIITRRGWGADEELRERDFLYTGRVQAAFVHHTASGNNYLCSQAPSVIRSIYRYHVVSSGWRDIGYNFLVDKCGNLYEGRAGGVAKPVMGAHTLGFNVNSTGVAVIGSYTTTEPPAATVKAISMLTAWKLGLHEVDPQGTTYLTSGGGNLYRKGEKVRLNVISGHRDGFATECPGQHLYGKLGAARTDAARLQGRT